MKKGKLHFFGTDFTPIITQNGENNFELITSNINKKTQELIDDKETQRRILIDFLQKAQNDIDNLIVDKSLDEGEKRLYDYHNQQIWFGGLVGVVSQKDFIINDGKKSITVDVSLRIITRMDGEYGNSLESSKPYFLMNLLFRDYRPTNNKISSGEDKFTDMLLLFSFMERYKEAYVKGCFKTYHRFEKNDDRFKGAIDIARHIRSNMGMHNGKISYSFKEKSDNNYVNHLVVAAYEQLKSRYFDLSRQVLNSSPIIRDSIESLKYQIGYPQYNKRTLLAKNTNALSHPYYTEYEELRKVCIKVLNNEKASMLDGNNSQTVNGVLMYVPRLWEKYIERNLHGCLIRPQSKIHVFDVNDDKKYRQLTIPDFVLSNENGPFMILDAKFKPGWLDASKNGHLSDNLLADYDKCIRDMVSINSHMSGVVFPTNENVAEYSDSGYKIGDVEYKYQHNISSFNDKDKFYTFPVYVPGKKENYLGWKTEFESKNKKLFDSISTVIHKASTEINS